MSTPAELQARVDHLESILRERDRADAEAKAAALAAKNATDDALDNAARVAAAAAQRETIRRGAWASHLIGQADPAARLDFAALDKQIPADGWPVGTDETRFIFDSVAPKTIDIETTHMGKLLKGGH